MSDYTKITNDKDVRIIGDLLDVEPVDGFKLTPNGKGWFISATDTGSGDYVCFNRRIDQHPDGSPGESYGIDRRIYKFNFNMLGIWGLIGQTRITVRDGTVSRQHCPVGSRGFQDLTVDQGHRPALEQIRNTLQEIVNRQPAPNAPRLSGGDFPYPGL